MSLTLFWFSLSFWAVSEAKEFNGTVLVVVPGAHSGQPVFSVVCSMCIYYKTAAATLSQTIGMDCASLKYFCALYVHVPPNTSLRQLLRQQPPF